MGGMVGAHGSQSKVMWSARMEGNRRYGGQSKVWKPIEVERRRCVYVCVCVCVRERERETHPARREVVQAVEVVGDRL